MKRLTLSLACAALLVTGALFAQGGRYFVGTGDFRATEIGADGKTFLEVAPAGTVTARNSASLVGFALTGTSLAAPSLTAPVFVSSPTGYGVTQYAEVAITKVNILAMNATPVAVVAGVTEEIVEFCGAVLITDYAGAAYGGGGDVVLQSGTAGAAVSNTVAKTDSFGAAGDKIFQMNPLNAAGGFAVGHQSGIYITNGTGAFTAAGDTAVGVGRLKICYRRWASGL